MKERRDLFGNREICPEIFLLWFHRCAWDYRLKSGQTLWDGLCEMYREGAREAAVMEQSWNALVGRIDARRHREVADRLAIQARDAAAWSNHILRYFQTFSKRALEIA